MKRITFIIFILFIPIFVFSQGTDSLKSTKISGRVKDQKGKPVNGANVVIQGTIDGATTDETGLFEFETEKSGKKNLLITSIEFSDKIFEIDIVPGKNLNLDIVLSPEVKTEEIIVTASTFTSGINSQVTLTPLEITRIPGADADLFRAIATFPGSTQVDEGSKISVRGGDPNEVLTILDQASLYNPFIFGDASNTSTYSTVDPWGLKGINFSSGGFSAKYGNVLSAILDLQSYDIPRTNSMFFILGLVNAGLAGVFTNKQNNFGGTFTIGGAYVKPLLDLNGINIDYEPMPVVKSFGGTVSYKPTKTSLFKYYLNYVDDKLGIRNQSPVYDGYFKSKEQQLFNNLIYSMTPTNVSLLRLSLSFSSDVSNVKYGVLDNTSKTFYSKFRSDFSIPLTNTIDFASGVEYEYNKLRNNGIVPIFSYNIRPDAPSFTLSQKNNAGRFGLYSEAKFKILNNLNAITGVRGDYYTISKEFAFDPRFSVVYRISDNSFLRGAIGIYHQNPGLQSFSYSGSNDLKPERAIHYILGYEFNSENDIIFRVESYYKDYKNLISTSLYNYSLNSDGYGSAKGVDVFFKLRTKSGFNGWISYAYTDSKRKQFGSLGLTSADFDITHNLAIVATYDFGNNYVAGATYRISTGKPYTPVAGSYYDSLQTVFVPVYGDRNSDRFPAFQRVDLNFQHFFSMFKRFVVVFASLTNLLNQENLYAYTYNFDYSQKIKVRSTNPRTFYMGFGVQL